jgi:hypothetical protein
MDLFATDGAADHLLPYTLGQKQIDGSLKERKGETIGVTPKPIYLRIPSQAIAAQIVICLASGSVVV